MHVLSGHSLGRARFLICLALTLVLFTPLIARSVYASGTITGTAFRDFNGNGAQDTGEIGIAGIQVDIFDSTDTNQGSDTTDSNGNYSIAAGGTGPYRVEFTIPTSLSAYQPAAEGSNDATSVQFITDGNHSNVDFAVNYPGDFCQNNPELCATSYVNGSRTDASVSALSAQYQWDYDNGGTAPAPTQTVDTVDVGATWGLALARTTKELYIGAVVKRHVDIGPGDGAGSNPYGAIYLRDLTTGSVSFFTTIPNAGTVTGRDMTTATSPSHDTDAYAKVGKVGLGGLTISDDETTLYVTNLNDGNVYQVNLVGSPTPTSIGAPSVTCNNGVYRPWAVKFWQGLLYAGGVCDASTGSKSDLQARVYTYDPGSATWSASPVLNSSLEMLPNKGGPVANMEGIVNCNSGSPSFYTGDNGYHPWNDAGSQATLATGAYYCRNSGATGNPHILVHPMPIFSDIEFDVDGSMMLGITDRFGNMIGWRNWGIDTDTTTYDVIVGGDVLRACPTAGTWTMESNGACGSVATAGANTSQGIGGGEWYYGDETPADGSQKESAEGGLTFVPGKGEVVSTAQDPYTQTIAQGVIFQANSGATPGANSDTGYQLYVNSTANSLVATFGKANGLGDLVALCDAAPVEIGNRIWNDANGNGIQDADEDPIADIDVELWMVPDTGPVLVATARTDANGNYYFSNDMRGYPATGNSAPNAVTGSTSGGFADDGQGGRTSTASHKYGLLGLTQNTNFEIRVDTASTQNAPLLAGFTLTLQGAGTKNTIDSDAALVGNTATITDATGNAGFNNHTYDIGFEPPPPPPPPTTEDYGDLPDTGAGTSADNYQTLATDNGPHHTITAGLNIGAPDVVDGEDGTLQNSTATADDTTNTGYADDEDGIASFPTFVPGQTANIDVTVNNPSGGIGDATLYGFIDWNGDGDFNDTGEATTVAVPDNTIGTVTLSFNVPANAALSTNLGARFRLTTDDLSTQGAVGAASDGEVEDYIINIAADYGDLPDTGAGTGAGNYQTLASDGGPVHIISTGLNIGAPDVVDAEDGTLQNATATADDNSNTGYANDEDGVTSFPIFTRGQPATVNVTVNNPAGGIGDATLYGFIDWNADGDFDDAGEAVSATVPDNTIGTVNLNFNVPANAVTGTNLGARFRLTTDTLSLNNSGAIGFASNGEVEDYTITIVAVTADEMSRLVVRITRHNKVRLKWRTLSESQIAGFNIQRRDGKNGVYQNINATVLNAKNPGNPQNNAYKVIDRSAAAGKTYWYRIEIIHIDGTITTGAPQKITLNNIPPNH